MPKVTPAHEQRRREQILAAALACFARHGYRATSMDDLVRESGLSVGAIYTYYPSKEDLFLALADLRTGQILDNLKRLYQRPGPIADKTQEAADLLFDLLSDELEPSARVSLEFWSEASKSERLQVQRARQCEAIREFLHWLMAEAQRSGELRPDIDLAAAAELVMALNDGILTHHVTGVQPVPREVLKAAYVSFVIHGLASTTQVDSRQSTVDSSSRQSAVGSQQVARTPFDSELPSADPAQLPTVNSGRLSTASSIGGVP
ncbi:MAG: TetR/AcrR family transcriptional regulator [Chloroflexi bacterium]|nr:TetR/AcrR family transcriptional regulator [Chloroflexota bacterium]